MKKVLVCGMLLGFLTSVSFAQRGGRAMGGFGTNPTRIPNAVPATPNATFNPGAISHGGVLPNTTHAPNATDMGKDPNPAHPNATFGPNATTSKPNAARLPGESTMPDVRTPNIPER